MLVQRLDRPAAAIQCQVIGALIMREMASRYGRENLGFLWLIVEPMILTAGVMTIWSLFRVESHGVTLIAFVLSGYMPLTLWRHISSHGVLCLRQNLPLLYHRSVRPLDVVIARSLLEMAGVSLALVIVYSALRLVDLIDPYADLGLLLAGWLYMAWFAFAAALVLAAASETFHFIEKLIAPFQYLILPISGTFFMVAWLPSNVRQVALYVPLVDCFELFRAGLFGEQMQTFYSLPYLTEACVFTSAAGLLLVRAAGRRLTFEQ